MLFLQILGVLFLVVLLGLGYLGFRIWRGLRSAAAFSSGPYATVISVLPPINMSFEAMPKERWLHPEQLKADQAVLSKLGFTHSGDFSTTHHMSEMHVSIWLQPQKAILVAILEGHSPEQEEVPSTYGHDVILQGKDTVFTLTNNAQGALLPRPTHLPYMCSESANLTQLLQSLKMSLPDGFKKIAIKDAVGLYQKGVQDYAAWLWQKPALGSDELNSVFEPLNIKIEGNLLTDLVDHGFNEHNILLQERIWSRLAESGKFSAAQWESMRDRLVVIHERMRPCDVAQTFYELFDYETIEPLEAELETLSEDRTIADPFALLENLLSKVSGSAPKRIASMAQPVKATVFLGEAN